MVRSVHRGYCDIDHWVIPSFRDPICVHAGHFPLGHLPPDLPLNLTLKSILKYPQQPVTLTLTLTTYPNPKP